jgi:hypothetical protein
LFQSGAVLAQTLGTLRLVPDVRILEFATNFYQLFLFGVEVKDTPSRPLHALSNP